MPWRSLPVGVERVDRRRADPPVRCVVGERGKVPRPAVALGGSNRRVVTPRKRLVFAPAPRRVLPLLKTHTRQPPPPPYVRHTFAIRATRRQVVQRREGYQDTFAVRKQRYRHSKKSLTIRRAPFFKESLGRVRASARRVGPTFSVGNRRPAHAQYASASAYDTCTTGCFPRPRKLEPSVYEIRYPHTFASHVAQLLPLHGR